MFLSEKVKIKLYPLFLVMRAFLSIPGELYRSWIRNLDGVLGFKLRYWYYKKKLEYLGRNVKIDTGVFFYGNKYISIGDSTEIDKNCIIVGCYPNLDLSHRYLKTRENVDYKGKRGFVSIGSECHISQNAMIYGYGGVHIGNNSVLSTGAKIYSLTSIAYNPYDRSEIVSIVPYSGKSPTLEGPVVLGDNVWIGIDTVVSPGVTIKKNSFVQSFSLVNSSFDENTYAGGLPATRLRDRYENYHDNP